MVDLGCWPGGWLQVASERVGESGRVVGVDLTPLDPPLQLANVIAIAGDFSEARVLEEILAALGGPAQVLLCDAAPRLTGVRDADRAREEALLEAVEAALPRLLRPGGDLLCKLLDGPEADAIARRLGALVPRVAHAPSRGHAQGQRRALLAGAGPLEPRKLGAQRAAGERSSRKDPDRHGDRPFTILGVQQIAVGAPDKRALRRLWVDLLGLRGRGQLPQRARERRRGHRRRGRGARSRSRST